MSTTVNRTSPQRVVGGLLLLLPAVVSLFVGYVAPTFATVRMSTQNVTPLRGSGRDVGMDNYGRLGEEVGSAFGFGLALAVLPLLTVLVLAPALAYAAHRAGRIGRRTARVALAVPMVCFAPAALATAWQTSREIVASPNGARASVMGAVWLTTVGLVCGVAVTLYLAALRRRDAGQRTWLGVLVVAALAGLATIALALQAFTYPRILTGGGPADATNTPTLVLFERGFVQFRFGDGAATATVLLLALGVLGVAAVLVVVLAGARIEVDPSTRSADDPGRWTGGRIVAVVLGGAGLLLVLALAVYGLWPWLSRLGATEVEGVGTGRVVANTWLPPLVSTVVGVLFAALAGFGIGAVRPLGRWSEVLLLPFAPWLFVGVGPLSLAHFNDARADDELNTFWGLVPPLWLPVPALVVFTLLARGQERRWREAAGAWGAWGWAGAGGRGARPASFALAALPMVLVAGLVTWVVQAQDLTWALVAGSNRDHLTGPVAVAQAIGGRTVVPDTVPVGVALPVVAVVVLAVALVVLQLTYLDRVALRTRVSDRPPAPPPGSPLPPPAPYTELR